MPWRKGTKPLIGMVHLRPLPGSPRWAGNLAAVLEAALADAQALERAGFDAVLVENFGDVPFSAGPVEPHTVAAMAWVLSRLRGECSLPLGVNVLRNDWRSALALAAVCGGAFVRVNVLSGVMVTDQGIITGNAHDCLRYRKFIEATAVAILADVCVKHGQPLAPGNGLVDLALDVQERGLADALILTGRRSGEPANIHEVTQVRRALPDALILLGSGVCVDNASHFRDLVDGFIVGTAVKDGQRIEHPVSPSQAEQLVRALRGR
jgi:membrane complex biogenesis BtpA family protein